jgi:hypothetical protein
VDTPPSGAGPPLAMLGHGVGPSGAFSHHPFAYKLSSTRKP